MKKIDNLPPVVVMDVNLQALKVIRSLGRRGVRVIGVVPEGGRWESTSRYCETRVCKYAKEAGPEFRDYLLDLAKELGEKPVLVPMQDDNVLFVSRHREELENMYRFCMGPPEIIESLVSKSRMAELARRCSIDQPGSYEIHSLSDIEDIAPAIMYPALIKPEFSRSWQTNDAREVVSGKVVVVQNTDELRSAFSTLANLDNRLVVQEMVPGPDRNLVYYIGYFDRNSAPLASFVGRKDRVVPVHFGSASYVTSFYDEELIRMSETFMTKIGYQGHVGIEYKYDDRSMTYKLIEVNARFGLWDGLATLVGIDFSHINYSYLTGQEIVVCPEYDKEVKWLSFERDWAAYRQYSREGQLGFRDWMKSITRGERDFAVFAWDDPVPFIRSTLSFVGKRLVKPFRRLLPA